jgi:predicted secreted protein
MFLPSDEKEHDRRFKKSYTRIKKKGIEGPSLRGNLCFIEHITARFSSGNTASDVLWIHCHVIGMEPSRPNKRLHPLTRSSQTMVRQISLALAMLIIVFFLFACGKQSGLTIQLAQADSGATVKLHPGDILEIVLSSNPTTGYTWEVQPGSEAVLRLRGEPEFRPDSNVLGSGGRMTFRFDAVAVGEVPLALLYWRAFEPGVPPLQRFAINVRVVKI